MVKRFKEDPNISMPMWNYDKSRENFCSECRHTKGSPAPRLNINGGVTPGYYCKCKCHIDKYSDFNIRW